MKKVTLLVLNKYSSEALRQLRKLGLIHIKHTQRPAAEGITSIEHRVVEVDKALEILADLNAPAGENKELDKEEVSLCLKRIIVLDIEKERRARHQRELEEDLAWFQEWGDVSASLLTELEPAGVFIKLYTCAARQLRDIPADKTVQVLKRKGKRVYLALVAYGRQEALNFSEVKPPSTHKHSTERKMVSTQMQAQELEAKLKELCGYRNYLSRYKKEQLKRLEFYKAKFGMGYYEEGFCCLEGFCPAKSTGSISELALAEGWAYSFEEPDEPQDVPTLLRNPRWVEIIKPVFKFMGTLPGYEEYDISFWFLLFFSVFFALLIGDAGYGLIFFGAVIFARRRLKQAPRPPFILMGVLSAATILWGAVTGTWFGVEKIAQLPFLNSLVIDRVNSFVQSNQVFMMYLCFLIGVVQLTIAHGIIAWRYINSPLALGQAGWICILWGLFFLIGEFVVDKPVPGFFPGLMVLGAALVVLFSSPHKNKLKGALITLGNLPLKAISSFADILSYLRLFVIGYVSVMVAGSFNALAVQVGFNNILTGLAAALILFFGHSLNIVLGLLSVLVHGIRLNMLEFSGHLDIQWAGKEYRPFSE